MGGVLGGSWDLMLKAQVHWVDQGLHIGGEGEVWVDSGYLMLGRRGPLG